MVCIISHISGSRKTLYIKKDISRNYITYDDILHTLSEKEGTCSDVFLTCEGKVVTSDSIFDGNVSIVATLRLRGGKGGFGSMLRAIGAQIEKTTNREACRDLSGRRLRDINEEKRLKEFLSKKVEKEKERIELKRKKLEQMKEGPKHNFEDKAYFEQREKRERDIYDSLDKAFAAGSTKGVPSKATTSETSKNNNKRLMLDDLDDSSEDDSSDDDSDNNVELDTNAEVVVYTKTQSENDIEKTTDLEVGSKREHEDSDPSEHTIKKLKT